MKLQKLQNAHRKLILKMKQKYQKKDMFPQKKARKRLMN